ncbi:molecular chaperone TorD family protein [Halomonas aquamarina]|uniref:Molecular chaperone TorD family protein n=1 Tax=Vreelandella aquamarina TaxID=77097 RepID=A0ACC5VXF9_9GAMM|nr:molecular chaperone TorD family protein [Halomonas aquamarina]MBZ5488481.1 molecular chaperone TorD family protein [Halomonas aquamarina]
MNDEQGVISETEAIRADIYQLLASLIRQPPDTELLEWLATLESDADGSRLAECWAALIQAARSSTPEALSRAHFNHLVGVIQGDIVPYASFYLNGELMDSALVALRRDLRMLGFERRDAVHEPEDHLAAECEVMAMLIVASRDEQVDFFQRHIAPWAGRCFADMGRLENAFYAATGQLGSAFIESERASMEAQAAYRPVRIMTP